MAFVKASKKQQKARVALIGPPGSGKTYTALTIGKDLGNRVALIDTERGSASKYAGDVADFETSDLDGHYSPNDYIREIREAARAGFDVLIVDSLSHAWEGEGGILDQVDKRGGKFDAWRDMAPQTRALIDAILTYPGHVIATMRVKTEYVVEQVEKRGGRIVSEPRKVGLAPKFKEGLEYEFDVVGTLDEENVLRVSKSRAPALSGQIIAKPGKQFADALRAWLDDGAPAPARVEPAPAPQPAAALPSGEEVEAVVREALDQLDAGDAAEVAAVRERVRRVWSRLSPEQRTALQAARESAEARLADAEAAQ